VDLNNPGIPIPSAPRLPQGAVEAYAEVNGTRIWHARWSGNAPAEPVLLLHGGLMNADYFGYLVPALISRGYGVIAVDSRSQGRSPYAGGPITYEAMEQDIVGLLNHLRVQRVSLVGWSDGGIVGLQLAIRHPDLLSRVLAFGANTNPAGNIEDADSLPTMVAHARIEHEEYLQLSPTPARWEEVRAAVLLMWRTLPEITDAQLRGIRVPTTICVGQYDECIKPEHTRHIAAQIPGATLTVLPDATHFAMVQNPAVFNQAILEFLGR
jgi:pimeloyl-ACP methyl ester carboxylesterase